jgi:hypothetical protein
MPAFGTLGFPNFHAAGTGIAPILDNHTRQGLAQELELNLPRVVFESLLVTKCHIVGISPSS